MQNGSGVAGAAGKARDDLGADGFALGAPAANADRSDYDVTEVRYGPGAKTKAQLVLAYLGGAGKLVSLDSAPSGADVVLVLGRRFPRGDGAGDVHVGRARDQGHARHDGHHDHHRPTGQSGWRGSRSRLLARPLTSAPMPNRPGVPNSPVVGASMSVAVIGAGYVGLTTAACLAHLGHEVVCADIDAERVARLPKGEVPDPRGRPAGAHHRGPGLQAALVRGRRRRGRPVGRDRVPVRADAAGRRRRRRPELRRAASPARSRPSSTPKAIVVNKSTVPVGSTRFVQRVLAEAGTPRRARHRRVEPGVPPRGPGRARLPASRSHRDRLRRPGVGGARVASCTAASNAPVLVTDPASAEMIKYASNAFLATKVSFINAIANLCEAVDADVREVAIGMGYDARIGFQFLHPGPGYGGSCFPKDVAALLHTAREAGYDFQLLDGVVDVNVGQHERIIDKVRAAAGGRSTDAQIAVWGLTFKADTDDLRDSPALVIARAPARRGRGRARLRPGRGRDRRARSMPGLDVRPDPYEAAAGADVVALLTEWEEFRWLDFERVRDADAPTGDRRRPQPARSGRDAPARLRLPAGVGRR